MSNSKRPALSPVGIIGGSGFASMRGFSTEKIVHPETPFGKPSGPLHIGTLEGAPVVFLPRHGEHHALAPDRVPYRANIFALKMMGVRTIVGVSAVGSLSEMYEPGDLAVPDDLYDRTVGRRCSFFGEGLVAHVGFARPFCSATRDALLGAKLASDRALHDGGTLVVIQGPRFSTLAESRHFRSSGFSLIGMTTLPEAVLAREAEIPYATLAIVTDFDAWHAGHDAVSVELVLTTLSEASARARAVLREAIPVVASLGERPAHRALDDAIQTPLESADPRVLDELKPILARWRSDG